MCGTVLQVVWYFEFWSSASPLKMCLIFIVKGLILSQLFPLKKDTTKNVLKKLILSRLCEFTVIVIVIVYYTEHLVNLQCKDISLLMIFYTLFYWRVLTI